MTCLWTTTISKQVNLQYDYRTELLTNGGYLERHMPCKFSAERIDRGHKHAPVEAFEHYDTQTPPVAREGITMTANDFRGHYKKEYSISKSVGGYQWTYCTNWCHSWDKARRSKFLCAVASCDDEKYLTQSKPATPKKK